EDGFPAALVTGQAVLPELFNVGGRRHYPFRQLWAADNSPELRAELPMDGGETELRAKRQARAVMMNRSDTLAPLHSPPENRNKDRKKKKGCEELLPLTHLFMEISDPSPPRCSP
ncbi:hypothetical protein BHE74_00056917, partial [Ensete ventricosum]